MQRLARRAILFFIREGERRRAFDNPRALKYNRGALHPTHSLRALVSARFALATGMATLDRAIAPTTTLAQTRRLTRRSREALIGLVFILPAFFLITIFHIIPAGYALWISLQSGSIR